VDGVPKGVETLVLNFVSCSLTALRRRHYSFYLQMSNQRLRELKLLTHVHIAKGGIIIQTQIWLTQKQANKAHVIFIAPLGEE
jgi:hypothetical protein